MKRAFTKRLSLTARKLRNFTKIVKRQDNGECPRVVYYYYSWFVISIYGIPRKCSIYTYCVGFCVVRLRRLGQCEGLRVVVMGKGQDSHAFFCICSILSLTNPILGNLSENEFEGIVLNNIEQVNGKVVLSINVVF